MRRTSSRVGSAHKVRAQLALDLTQDRRTVRTGFTPRRKPSLGMQRNEAVRYEGFSDDAIEAVEALTERVEVTDIERSKLNEHRSVQSRASASRAIALRERSRITGLETGDPGSLASSQFPAPRLDEGLGEGIEHRSVCTAAEGRLHHAFAWRGLQNDADEFADAEREATP